MVKRVILFLLAFMLSMPMVGCNKKSYRRITTEYFIFYKYNKANYVILEDFTEEGKKQEIIVLPSEVEGFPLIMISDRFTYFRKVFYSENIKKIYLPYTVNRVLHGAIMNGLSALQEVIVCNTALAVSEGSILSGGFAVVYTQEYFDLKSLIISNHRLLPNYVFKFNYENSPNQDIYWIDNIEKNNLYVLPENPKRKDYIFTGWYTEKECINKWDEVLTPAEDTVTLYAGWTQG